MNRHFAVGLVLVIALLPAPSGAATAQTEGLGMLSFPNSGAAAAQPAFIRGVLLLHNFEYEDAAEAFQEAERIDPDFALAYWGEALTHQRLLWGQDFLAEARAVLLKLGPDPASRAAKAGTDRERGYLAAVEALLGEGDEDTRTRAFEAAMTELHQSYAEDDEAAAFNALAILMAGDYGRVGTASRAAALVEDVARRNPYHPGAIHYLIHSYDSPEMAPLGLHWAKVYSRLAPEAEHALHMPSHIFINLGLWNEVAASNEASIRASYSWVERKGLGVLDLDYHSHQWLSYAYLQLGRRDEARVIRDSVTALLRWRDVRGLHWNVANGIDIQQVQWGFETGDWSWYRDTQLPDVSPSAGFLQFALPLYGRGMAAATAGDGDLVAVVAELLRSEAGPRPEVRDGLAHQIEARLALATGHLDLAVNHSGAALELLGSRPFGSPAIVQPPYEAHGEILLAAGLANEAAAAFDRALEQNPGRARSLLGRARAGRDGGDQDAAKRYYRLLVDNWQRADEGLPELAEAKEYLSDQ